MLVLKNEEHGYKELIISYKTMYINTYTINVVDLSDKLVIFRHARTNLSNFGSHTQIKCKGFLSSAIISYLPYS